MLCNIWTQIINGTTCFFLSHFSHLQIWLTDSSKFTFLYRNSPGCHPIMKWNICRLVNNSTDKMMATMIHKTFEMKDGCTCIFTVLLNVTFLSVTLTTQMFYPVYKVPQLHLECSHCNHTIMINSNYISRLMHVANSATGSISQKYTSVRHIKYMQLM